MRNELKLCGGLVVLALVGTFVLMNILVPPKSKFPANFSRIEKGFVLRHNDFPNRPWLFLNSRGRKSIWI